MKTETAVTKKRKSPLIIILIVLIIGLLLCCCCSIPSLVLLGIAGSLPADFQKKYDEGNWVWNDSVDEYTDRGTSDYPNGDAENWWYDATDEERAAYIKENGYPYVVNRFDWDSYDWNTYQWDTAENCEFTNSDVEEWWYDTTDGMRECYIWTYGLPSFLYDYDFYSSGWYDEESCDFPSGDSEYWWEDANNEMKDCYVWMYGLPEFLYYGEYDDLDSEDANVDYDTSCYYDELDCDFLNGDIEFWWPTSPENEKSCYISLNGLPSFWQGGVCAIPDGEVEEWWCETDEDTHLCYIDEYGLPWFLE